MNEQFLMRLADALMSRAEQRAKAASKNMEHNSRSAVIDMTIAGTLQDLSMSIVQATFNPPVNAPR